MATVPSGQAAASTTPGGPSAPPAALKISAASATPGGPSAPPAALKISDFQVLSKLGEGGFGTVLLAKKKSSGKLYAVSYTHLTLPTILLV